MKSLQLTLCLIFLTIPWTTLQADPWGQLFTSPAQRAQLDSGQAAPVKTDDSSGNTAQAGSLQPIQVTGTLTSSRGKRVVWLNGKPVTQGVRVLGAGRVELHVTSDTDHRLVKSGQLLYPQTGEIVEGYAALPASPVDVTEQTAQTEMGSADAPM